MMKSADFLSEPQLSMDVLLLRRSTSVVDSPDTTSAVIALWKDFKDLFNTRTLRIESDSVGYGFVLRGDGPTYVQTVDPSGPAAEAGLRVGHILENVNDLDVMNMNHKDVAKVILGQDSSSVTLNVLEPADFKNLC